MQNEQHHDQYEQIWIIAVSITLAVFLAALIVGALVFGVRVPESGGFINPNELQDTQFANPGLYERGDGEYEAIIVAQMWNFITGETTEVEEFDFPVPSITVPVDSFVTFTVTSRDITHGLILEHHNLNFEIVPGHISQARIRLTRPGTYHFVCHEYCGQLHHRMHGVVIVEEADESVASSVNEE